MPSRPMRRVAHVPLLVAVHCECASPGSKSLARMVLHSDREDAAGTEG
jgi:hypothetical protein